MEGESKGNKLFHSKTQGYLRSCFNQRAISTQLRSFVNPCKFLAFFRVILAFNESRA